MRLVEFGNLVFDIKNLLCFQPFFKRAREDGQHDQYGVNMKFKGACENVVVFFDDPDEYHSEVKKISDAWLKFLGG